MSARHQKKRNHDLIKVLKRELIASVLESNAQVLELFSGSGSLYRKCWRRFGGATIDKEASCSSDAAIERPSWSCYNGDTERALDDGWMNHRAFDVVDCDCYGQPWPFVEALFSTERKWPDEWWLVCTDGYISQRNITKKSKSVFGGSCELSMSGITESMALKSSRDVVRRCCRETGQVVAAALSFVGDHKTGRMWTHIFLIQRGEIRETRRLAVARSWAGGRRDTARRRG